MHDYRRFVQQELDARGWEPADLVKRSGLSRQLVWKILSDKRSHLGQMPDDTTMQAIADGFGVSVERVQTAAARSLRGYSDDGAPLSTDLTTVPIDALLHEVRRRVLAPESGALGVDGQATAGDSEPDALINRWGRSSGSGRGAARRRKSLGGADEPEGGPPEWAPSQG